ncbi:TPA: phage tail tape measure protein [Escherichia coli]|nr:phage tail tape measure protein [Escherichia coli]
MAGNFSVGVVIGGLVGSTFRSAMSGTRRALDSLGETSRRLQERQNALTRATERYGQLGGARMQQLNRELLRVGRTMEQIERQQRRLSAASATGDALKANRMALYGQGVETYAMAQTVYHTISPALQQSMSFEDKMIDMSITAKYDAETQNHLAAQIKGWALKYNQNQDEMQEAVGSLISNNIDSLSDIGYYMPDIARAATATRTAGADWAKVAAVWQTSLKGAAEDFGTVQNIMAYAGDQGSFEIPDQVKWMQSLAPMMEGVASGKDAVAEIGASLQIAKIGAGSTDEAANNFKNFLTKIFARDTQKQFADLGIDLQASLESYKSAGISPIEGMMSIIERYLNTKSPEALAGFKSAMKIENDTARDEALQALAKNFGLGEMFADQQVMAFIRPMLANMDRYREIRAGALKAADNDLLGTAYDRRLQSPLEATKALMINSRDLAITLGDQLAPSFVSLAQELLPLIQKTKNWITLHPELVSGAIQIVAALLAFKASTIALKLGLNLLLSPFVSVWKNLVLLRANWLRLTLAFGEGGKLRWLATGLSSVGKGAASLGKILAGGLLKGLMLAGKAILWVGKALLMNPIGLIITGIAVAAYLLYRYWGPVSAFFKRLWAQVTSAFSRAWQSITAVWQGISGWFSGIWTEIKTAFDGGIAGVGQLVLNWSPLGLFHKAFAGVLSWFGIDMPKSFTDFGKNLITGLVDGISNQLTAAKETIVNFGSSVSSWFKETLGINSPSRVFMGFGDNIVQGAAIGLQRTTPLATKASQQLADHMVPSLPVIIPDNLIGQWVNDVSQKITAVKNRLTGPGASLFTWFSDTFPSFSAMSSGIPPAVPPVLPGLHIAESMSPAAPRIPPDDVMAAGYAGQRTGKADTAAAIQVSFNPQFFLNNKETTVPDKLSGALNMSLHELEKMLARLLAQKQRRGYE